MRDNSKAIEASNKKYFLYVSFVKKNFLQDVQLLAIM